MLRQGYWLFEFVSISEILVKAPAKYARSFLFTETDQNDATYFLLYQCEVIGRAIASLHEYIDTKSKELRETEALLRGATELNYRQQALIAHALRKPGTRYTIEGHRRSHAIVYETARYDLMDLARLGLLESRKVGRAFVFIAPADLGDPEWLASIVVLLEDEAESFYVGCQLLVIGGVGMQGDTAVITPARKPMPSRTSTGSRVVPDSYAAIKSGALAVLRIDARVSS